MTARRLTAPLLAALACVALVACGSDDGGKATPTTTERATTTSIIHPTPSNDKQTPVEVTPTETESPEIATPTAPPPADEGIRATLVPDQAAYLTQFQGRNLQEGPCTYNPVTRVTDCGDAKYAIDPPIVGQDINCYRGVVDGQNKYIRCQSVEPQQSLVYEIQP